jgi:hypothetical protein
MLMASLYRTNTSALDIIAGDFDGDSKADLLVRDPFHVQSIANWFNLGADRRTRVIVFASSLELGVGELPASVVMKLVDGNNQTHAVPGKTCE